MKFKSLIFMLLITSDVFANQLRNKVVAKETSREVYSTDFNFNDIAIGGEMKAPDGFYLQGRKSQSLSQMVKLRSNFKSRLRNSVDGINACVK